MNRKISYWKLRRSELQVGERTLIMGVLNVTPDSFSDGGRYSDPDRAFARALELEEEGADIIDIGAESTRPGSHRISAEEEWRRLVPVLKRLRDQLRTPLSLDTYKSETAERAFEYGVEIINDTSGLTFDPNLAKVVAEANAGLVLNHMRGTPETWSKLPPLKDVAAVIARELDATAHRAQRGGVERARIVIDPGLGFGKRKEQNAEILANLHELVKLDFPILVGPSRKSFLQQKTDDEKEFATAAAVTTAILNGAHIVRVHDVRHMRAAAMVADEVAHAAQAASEAEAEKKEAETVRRPKVRQAFIEEERPRPPRPPLAKPAPPAPPPVEATTAPPAAAAEPAAEGEAERPAPDREPRDREQTDREQRQDRPREGGWQPPRRTWEKGPPRDDRRPPARDDRRPPSRDDRRPAARDDRRPPARDDRRPPSRDDRGAPREDRRPAARDDRRPPPRDDRRPAARDDRRPAFRDDRPPRSRDDRRPPSGDDRRPPPRGDRRPPSGDDRRPPFRGDRRPPSGDDRRPPFRGDRRPPSAGDRRPPSGDRRPPSGGDRRPPSGGRPPNRPFRKRP